MRVIQDTKSCDTKKNAWENVISELGKLLEYQFRLQLSLMR
jgi:hypothetical protein